MELTKKFKKVLKVTEPKPEVKETPKPMLDPDLPLNKQREYR